MRALVAAGAAVAVLGAAAAARRDAALAPSSRERALGRHPLPPLAEEV